MLTLKKVAITGGIASGKSTVCSFLKELGAYTLSADQIVHELLTPHTDLGKKIIALLGPDIILEGEISRLAIAEKVFEDPTLLKNLEKLLHPEVQRKITTEFQALISSKAPQKLFVVEIPLLFECGWEESYDDIVVVEAQNEVAKARFLSKGVSEEEFERREKRLLPLEEKKKQAHFVIENNGTPEALKAKVIELNAHLQEHQ